MINERFSIAERKIAAIALHAYVSDVPTMFCNFFLNNFISLMIVRSLELFDSVDEYPNCCCLTRVREAHCKSNLKENIECFERICKNVIKILILIIFILPVDNPWDGVNMDDGSCSLT